jgi:queuine tRNA-ribosyltransferase
MSSEMLGPILVSIHNLTYYQRLMVAARRAIVDGELGRFVAAQHELWNTAGG